MLEDRDSDRESPLVPGIDKWWELSRREGKRDRPRRPSSLANRGDGLLLLTLGLPSEGLLPNEGLSLWISSGWAIG